MTLLLQKRREGPPHSPKGNPINTDNVVPSSSSLSVYYNIFYYDLPIDLPEKPFYWTPHSLVTQMPKPSTPKLEEEFTALLRNLEQRHKVKMLAISQGFRELVASVQGQCATKQDQVLSLSGFSSTQDGNNGRLIDPETDKAIQSFFNRFYTINLGTRLLIGKSCFIHHVFFVWVPPFFLLAGLW